jgi:protein-L-isoaspartate(D-aspartate) O-methyltransferase
MRDRLHGCLLVAVLALFSLPATAATPRQEHEAGMDRMIEAIRLDARQTAAYTSRATISDSVLRAMRAVPRDAFVPDGAQAYAFENTPLSIGHGQTISQPFVVALMTDLLEPTSSDRVLEIGTGSGYQAAVLAELVAAVYTIEIIPELAETAAARLQGLGYDSVQVKAGDGWFGWSEAGPFDGIIVTAVGEEIPPKLAEQLAPGGRMVLPLGPQFGGQMLVVVSKAEDGSLERSDVLPVQFVPLTGNH